MRLAQFRIGVGNQAVGEESNIAMKKLLTLHQTKTFYYEKDFIGIGGNVCGAGNAGAAAEL